MSGVEGEEEISVEGKCKDSDGYSQLSQVCVLRKVIGFWVVVVHVMSGPKDWMCDCVKSDDKSIDIVNGDRLVCQGQGNGKVIIYGDVEKIITNVMHVPDISVN
jgi:hypothetical protein